VFLGMETLLKPVSWSVPSLNKKKQALIPGEGRVKGGGSISNSYACRLSRVKRGHRAWGNWGI